jgi:hypothetical protein
VRIGLIALGLLVWAAPVEAAPRAAAPSYRSDARVQHIRAALAAVRAASATQLQQQSEYARVLVHGACASGLGRLKVECLMTAARRYCRASASREACALTMDIVLSNALADEQLIAPERRYQLMRAHKDWRRALAAELRRTQGELAVDFRLQAGAAAADARAAESIDRYCLTTSDRTGLAVPTCVASLVWFLSTNASDGQVER